jgi:hypothetical protein
MFSLMQSRRTVNIVHAHDARSHTLAALTGVSRLVVSRRVAFPIGQGAASRWKYRRAARYIAVSQFVKSTLLEGGIPDSHIAVVYDGVPEQPVSHGSAILAPQTSDPGKGSDLVQAACLVAGFPVEFSRNLQHDLAKAALFVYITRSEGLGSAVLLAMAAAVPVIASNVGGVPEIVEHDRTGLLVENTAESIADAIKRVMRDRALAERLANCARTVVREKFSIQRMVAGTIKVYGKLI